MRGTLVFKSMVSMPSSTSPSLHAQGNRYVPSKTQVLSFFTINHSVQDLVTILLGTNDCNANTDPTKEMPARMNSLLEHIMALAPNAQVFLSDVVATGQPWNTCIQTYNKLVPGIVSAWAAKGMLITYTSLYEPALAGVTGVCSSTSFEDGLCGAHEIHPTSAGYPRMASAFAVSIMKHFKA